MAQPLVVCDNLVKIYRVADLEVIALQGLDLRVAPGEMLALVGASGSGKSTLMHILGGLDAPTAGTCLVAGYDLGRLGDAQRLRYRRTLVGQLWQQSGRNLFPHLTILRNVELPQVAAHRSPAARRQRALALLDAVGLADKSGRFAAQLSGGEQQRASIAVALANAPRVLLADEPTGELDSETAAQILALLRQFNQQLELTVVLVTHDAAIAAGMDRTIAIRDGRTSAEAVRREGGRRGESAGVMPGLSTETHRESILIDKVGRLQLPREIFGRYLFEGRGEVRDQGDHIEIWPLEDDA